MASKATERIKRIMAKLEAEGKVPPPPPRRPPKPKPVKVPKVVPVVDDRCYCLRRFDGQLPNGFIRCYGCLDIRADRV